MSTDNQDLAQETANFEFAVATVNRLRPAFVVICGDLINKPGDAGQVSTEATSVWWSFPPTPRRTNGGRQTWQR